MDEKVIKINAEDSSLGALSGKKLTQKFEIKVGEKLGEGGVAEVYRVSWYTFGGEQLWADAAMKILKKGINPEFMKAEIRALNTLKHLENVLVIQEINFEYERPYFLMELGGETLRTELAETEENHLPWERTIELLTPIARTLHESHEKEVVHGDVKPANILLSGGDIERVALIDYIGNPNIHVARSTKKCNTQCQRDLHIQIKENYFY